MKKQHFILALLITLSQYAFAQNSNTFELEKILNEYIDVFNNMEVENSTNKTLSLFSDRYSGNTTYVKLSGGVINKSYSKKDLKTQLDEIVQDDEYKIIIKLNNILYTNQKEKAGTISALLEFTSFIDSKEAEKGTMLINLVAVKHTEGWKIIQNNMVRISKTKEIGDCVCNIYNKEGSKYITELYYPDGVTYSHAFESFQFTRLGNQQIIKTKGASYNWNKDTSEITHEKNVIGKAKLAKKAIEVIAKDTYKEPCRNIIFR